VPTYQYVCTNCGHSLEAVQSFTDAALTQCPTCSGQLRKVFSAVGVVFKGSGFYRTDSRETEKTRDMEKKNPSPKTKESGSNDAASTTTSKDSASKPSSGGDSSSTKPKAAAASSA
jgi:putative FmdB family regulatory protein